MILSVIAHIFSVLLELIRISCMSDHDKDLEILVLRKQLGIADRKLNRTLKPEKSEKLTLAVLVTRLKKQTNRPAKQFRQLIRLVQPETVFRWHRDLVRRKWFQENNGKRGRPRIDDQLE